MRPPLVGAETWLAVMKRAEYRCQCAGICGRSHATTGHCCPRQHSDRHPLAAADPFGRPFAVAARLRPGDLVALCPDCHAGVLRRARADQPEDQTERLF